MNNQETVKTIDALLKTRIPQKRTVVQRNQIQSGKDHGDSDSEKGKDGPDSDYDSEVENAQFELANKRLNDGKTGVPTVNIGL
jgi:hypothetical protein